MGVCSSEAQFVTNEEIPGQDKSCMRVFTELMLSQSDINKFYTAFKDMDADNRYLCLLQFSWLVLFYMLSHFVREDELIVYFQIEKTVLNRQMFRIFGESGYLDFLQFVCSVCCSIYCMHRDVRLNPITSVVYVAYQMWNFMSLEPRDMSTFAFHTFRNPTTMTMTAAQLEVMMITIHGRSLLSGAAMSRVVGSKLEQMRRLNENCGPDEFSSMCHAHRFLLDPIVMLQLGLRGRLIGESFWKRTTAGRYANDQMNKHDYILTISKEAIQSASRLCDRKQRAPQKQRRRSLQVLVNAMQKVAPVRNARVAHTTEQLLPEHNRRRRSLIKPILSNNESSNTVDFIAMLNDPKAHKKNLVANGSLDLMITVTNGGSDGPSSWKHAAKGGKGSNCSSPRYKNTPSPRSLGSPRASSADSTRSSPTKNSPRGTPRESRCRHTASIHDVVSVST